MTNREIKDCRAGAETIHRLSEADEALSSVYSQFSSDDDGDPSWPEVYYFRFGKQTLKVSVDSDSDELRFTLAPTGNAPHGRDQSHLHPWSLAMGTRVRWAWFLVNSQGYLDGLQIEFGFPGQGPSADITVQLLAVASEIKVAILGRR